MRYLILVCALVCFALNSLFTRYVINSQLLDEYTYTGLRLASGGVMLAVILIASEKSVRKLSGYGSWYGAITLLMYLVGFSLAYTALDAGFGALILFTSVTLTMVVGGLLLGQRLSGVQRGALVVALISLSVLINPVVLDISWPAVVAMVISGLGWGAYSLHGATLSERGQGATQSTAGSFIKCSLFVPIILLFTPSMVFTWYGAGLAIICGAITSGLGYVMWYQSLIWLKADTAATLQLTVPIITLFLGFILLSESISLIQAVCAAVILVSVGVYLKQKRT